MVPNNYIIYIFFHQFLFSSCAIPKSLHNYIKSSKKLEKYSFTLLMDFEKNSDQYQEEKIVLKNKNTGLNISEMEDRILNVLLCQKQYENDCQIGKRGYSISVLELLQNLLKFKVQYTVLDMHFESLDALLTNETTDLILCSPKINNTFYQVLYPTLKTSYALIYKPNKIKFNQDIFVTTFAGTLWLCFIIIIILLAICLNISTKRYNNIYGHPSWGTVDITFWAIAAACQQGLSSAPQGFSSKTIFLIGYLTAYMLYTGFAAGITSLLAVQNENPVLKIDDIEKMKFNVISYGEIQNLPPKYNYLINSEAYQSLDNFFEQLNKKKYVGITTKIALEQYFAQKTLDHCLYKTLELKETKVTKSFLVPKNSTFKKMFNYFLLRLEESGILNLTAEETRPSISVCEAPLGYSSAGLSHVRSAILLFLTGFSSSVVFLIFECLWNGYKHRIIGN